VKQVDTLIPAAPVDEDTDGKLVAQALEEHKKNVYPIDTTAPLNRAVEVTGHPIVHLWVTSTVDDGDFFAYLEEVDKDGRSYYLTEGVLRASQRKLDPIAVVGLFLFLRARLRK
jgi:predicted acyl esterase